MKVVLVNPPSPPEFRVSRGLMGGFGMATNPELLYPPIELAFVAAVLEREGHEVAIHDSDPVGADADAALAAVAAEAPELVLVDTSSTSLDRDLALARRVRASTRATVAMLGSQVTYAPEEIFTRNGEVNVDAVVQGEPEETARQLARRVAEGASLEGCEGLAWRAPDGSVVQEPEREKISDLDSLPFPARHLLRNELYRFPGIREPLTTTKTSRGCPLDCSFCGYTLAQGLRFRFRSPEHVVGELAEAHRTYGLRQVVFRDPIFTTRKDRIHDICDGILREGLDLAWQCETAIKCLDRPVLEKMRAAGCWHVSLGVESGNPEIQKKHCGNKLNDFDRAERVFRDCRELGIETRAFCMVGFPEETPAMVDDTIRLVERLDPDQLQVCAVTAYPGTPLYRMLRGTREFDYATMTGFLPLEGNEHMSAEDIQAKIREFYRRFYLRPRRIARALRDPRHLATKVRRYFTLFRQRA